MRSLVLPVLVGALLVFVAGCTKTGIGEKDVESKQRQIEDATEKLLDGPIPEDEQRD